MQTGVSHSPVRIGIMGGTFDPIHVAHLAVAAAAQDALELSKVLFVVANRPWQKLAHGEITPAPQRFAMVAAGLPADPRFEASDIEIRRGGESFTADTLGELRRRHPKADLLLIVGSDLLDGLDTWERSEEVRELAELAVIRRPGSWDATPPPGWTYSVVDAPPIELSSSDLREALAAGRSVEFLVPDGTRRLIDERGLYRSSLGPT